MDKHDPDKDNNGRRNSNTEYVPTKCRVTKPPPPKPAANPLQFVKVAPCPLFQKAHEQIKKVEEIKKERKDIRDETEDWQQNLDNWKSSRRKRQEHIIERVVEVKKLTEQEELDKARRKSKTFSEMIEDRSRGRHKFSIPIYDDDSNDLSDYGIGSSSSKTNSIKDVDTDDSCSILDEKENNSFDSPNNKNSSASNQSQSEDEISNISSATDENSQTTKNNNIRNYQNTYKNHSESNNLIKSGNMYETSNKISYNNDNATDDNEQYTYEGAIQDYRSKMQSKIKVDESFFTRNTVSKSKEYSEAQSVVPKGEISKRKGLFENDKNVELSYMESSSARRLSEDFANTRSIKDRLKSLEESTDQTKRSVDKSDIQLSVKERLKNLNNRNTDEDNNNINRPKKISSYLLEKSNSTQMFETKQLPDTTSNRPSSPESEMYMNKLSMFSKDLDNLANTKKEINNINYPLPSSSIEFTSDREDSGIHTADVSCSVSQADETVDTEIHETTLTTIPSCIEKLKENTENLFENNHIEHSNNIIEDDEKLDITPKEEEEGFYTKEEIIKFTEHFLCELIQDASDSIANQKQYELYRQTQHVNNFITTVSAAPIKPVAIYENIELKPYPNSQEMSFVPKNFIIDGPFSLTPPKLDPPKVKPPPPPPPDEDSPPQPRARMNSTKRIKKEINIKRSSFLGLDDQNLDIIDHDMIGKPPDLQLFVEKEAKLEKSLFRKIQEETRTGVLSKVESQDSGLDIDRGRLSSDTWCSSIGDSSTPSHERHDSEQTNSITSEEDEITKKEREIIEMVEKEEQCKDKPEYVNSRSIVPNNNSTVINSGPTLGSEEFDNPYLPQISSDYVDDQDSEVLKVEQELRQLEKEEMERKRENMLFRESRLKARLQNNRHSLENICDEMYPCYVNTGVNYRKSMPELEYTKSVTDIPSAYYENQTVVDAQCRKSMPDIQNEQKRIINSCDVLINHRKSMPELQHDAHRSAFKSPPPVNRQPIMPGKPLRIIKEPINNNHTTGTRQLSKHTLHALSAVPKPRHHDNWIHPKAKPESKNYNQHWVFQEAELRRISDQQKNVTSNRNWQQPRHEKHLPDSIIQSLTQRVQNRCNVNERNPPLRRPDAINTDYMQHPYLGHPQNISHALPTSPYSPTAALDDKSPDKILSVSGKKKCSYCGNELGRGAAMIIESLCLFYHMECFKCCVCHIQLGDGRMGTDVRVRNQKLHCHNCYSSDDGVKFSCV